MSYANFVMMGGAQLIVSIIVKSFAQTWHSEQIKWKIMKDWNKSHIALQIKNINHSTWAQPQQLKKEKQTLKLSSDYHKTS